MDDALEDVLGRILLTPKSGLFLCCCMDCCSGEDIDDIKPPSLLVNCVCALLFPNCWHFIVLFITGSLNTRDPLEAARWSSALRFWLQNKNMFYNVLGLKKTINILLESLKLYPVDRDGNCYLLHMIKLELQDNAAFIIFYKNVKSKDIIYSHKQNKQKLPVWRESADIISTISTTPVSCLYICSTCPFVYGTRYCRV